MTDELPLAGIVVLDLGQIYNGPYATLLMAMAGARVIKIEPPRGEAMRGVTSYPFASLNSNKESVTLNLKSAKGKEMFRAMVRKGDVVLENFAPDTMTNLGLGAQSLIELNPQLIYAAGSGYGRAGDHRDYLAMDVTVQAMSGIMSSTGEEGMPPTKAGAAACDFSGGMNLYGAVVSALLRRFRTGRGAIIDIAMQDSVVPMLTSNFSAYYRNERRPPPRTGNRHAALQLAPYNVYPASDGHIALICTREAHWRALVHAMGDDAPHGNARFADMASRAANMELVDAAVAAWTRLRSRSEILALLLAEGVPCAPVRDLDEVLHDRHLRERGMLATIEHPVMGELVVPTTPLRYVGEALPPLRRFPDLGEHNASVYGEFLGLDETGLTALKSEGVI